MKGCRPLTKDEIRQVSKQFSGMFETRNRSLFLLGVNTGGRISELLALKIDDVWQNEKPVSDLLYRKGIVKGKENARTIPINADGQKAITELITWHREQYGDLDPTRPLFPSRKRREDGKLQAISRKAGHTILCKAFVMAGLNGKLATHSLRKTFAQGVYDATGDLPLVQELLGHKNIATTRAYLSVSYTKMKQAVEAIELDKDKTDVLLHSISELSDNDLVIELQTRGFDCVGIITQLQEEREKVQTGSYPEYSQETMIINEKSKILHFPKRQVCISAVRH